MPIFLQNRRANYGPDHNMPPENMIAQFYADKVLKGPFKHIEGYCWQAYPLPGGDGSTAKLMAAATLYEDNRRLGPPNRSPADIGTHGLGSHLLWEEALYFSTHDNANPNETGRRYSLKVPRIERLPSIETLRKDTARFPISAETIDLYLAAARADKASYERFQALDVITMLHWHVLAIYELIAARAERLVVEIGAYIGGGTVALARASKRPIATVECGGAYTSHPTIPTDDIIADLRKNLSRFAQSGNVHLLEGFSDAPEVVKKLHAIAEESGGIDVLTIDADGSVERDLKIVLPYLSPDCIVVFDDYVVTSDEKMELVVSAVDRLTKSGAVRPIGVYGWGTWVGTVDLERLEQHLSALEKPKSEASVEYAKPTAGSRSAVSANGLEGILRGIMKFTWKGLACYTSPFDLALYSMLLARLRPRTIIEIGSDRGATALWLSDTAKMLGLDSRVISIDVEGHACPPATDLSLRQGRIEDLNDLLPEDEMHNILRPLLVIEDAGHFYETSLAALQFFRPWMRPGEYIVVEAGIIESLNAAGRFNGGPTRAVREFIEEHGARFEVDRSYCDFFGANVTWNADGYLRCIK